MSIMQTVATGTAIGALAVTAILGVVVREQQNSIDALVTLAALDAQFDMKQDSMVWDLHRRVLKLEKADDRIMAHVRWFVMRRSGSVELAKMELAVDRLEMGE